MLPIIQAHYLRELLLKKPFEVLDQKFLKIIGSLDHVRNVIHEVRSLLAQVAEGVNDAASCFYLFYLQVVLVDEERYFSLHSLSAAHRRQVGRLVRSANVLLQLLVLASKVLAKSFVEATIAHFDQLAQVLEVALLISARR